MTYIRRSDSVIRAASQEDCSGVYFFSAVFAIVLASANLAFAQSDQIEPNAGTWKTWVISSGKDFRVPPPPDETATAAELAQLRDTIGENDPQAADKIRFWDAGSPGYRWIGVVNNRFAAGEKDFPFPNRINAYLTMAIYDATIAAWESKYFYNRSRPAAQDPTLKTAVATPRSPSYPSEHAAVAGAAAAVLAHFLPKDAQSLQAMAEEAAQSRVQAGVQFPSDTSAGLELGRKVAEQVIAKAKADGPPGLRLFASQAHGHYRIAGRIHLVGGTFADHVDLCPRIPSGSASPTRWRDMAFPRSRLASMRAAASA